MARHVEIATAGNRPSSPAMEEDFGVDLDQVRAFLAAREQRCRARIDERYAQATRDARTIVSEIAAQVNPRRIYRHTAASHAVISGENLPLVGKRLGHRRHSTTAGYAHLADGHLVEAAEKIRSAIAQAMMPVKMSRAGYCGNLPSKLTVHTHIL